MILPLHFIQTSYIVFSITCIESYVLYAANIEDFRSIAKKIIPSQLADKLADIAAKTKRQEYEDSEQTDRNNPDDESGRKSPYPRQKDYKKKFEVEKQYGNINLDELIKRVKEQLEWGFKTTTVGVVATTERVKSIDHYYYKDDHLNVQEKEVENEQLQIIPSDAFTTQKQKYAMYNEENATVEYADDNVKETGSHQYDTRESKEIGRYHSENAKDDFVNSNGNIKEAAEYNNVDGIEETDYKNHNVKNTDIRNNEKVEISKYDSVNDKGDYEDVKNAPVHDYKNLEVSKYDYENGEIKNVAAYNNKDADEEIENNGIVQNAHVPKDNAKKNQYKERNQVAEYEENSKNAPEYYEENAQDTPPVDNIDIFKEVNMQKSNDSYEDYVTPARGNVFESGDHDVTTSKPEHIQKYVADNSYNQNNKPKAVADGVVKRYDNTEYVNKDEIAPASSLPKKFKQQKKRYQVKAKTESLWYKNANYENYDDSTKTTGIGLAGAHPSSKRKGLNTMLPTRVHFKMRSPNYLAKLPAIAEKYNFNEPIPEKDREPENIKYIGNPPAFINKKVRI